MKIGEILEGTFVLIMVYLVLRNSAGFSQATIAIGNLYTGAVRALQGERG